MAMVLLQITQTVVFAWISEFVIILAFPFCIIRRSCSFHFYCHSSGMGARGGAFGWGCALQAARSRVRFPMLSLEFFIDLNLPVTLWPWVDTASDKNECASCNSTKTAIMFKDKLQHEFHKPYGHVIAATMCQTPSVHLGPPTCRCNIRQTAHHPVTREWRGSILLVFWLPMYHANTKESARILAPLLLRFQKHTDLRAHDTAHYSHLWHALRLANCRCAWNRGLCGINRTIPPGR